MRQPKQHMHCFEQRAGNCASLLRRGVGAGLLRVRIPSDEDSTHAQPASRLDIRKRVADHDTGREVDLRVLCLRLFKEPRLGFAAMAETLVMRAEEKAFDMGAMAAQLLLQAAMQPLHIGSRVVAERHTPLVGDDIHRKLGFVEQLQGFFNTGQRMEDVPAGHILAFTGLPVQYAIAVEKDCLYTLVIGSDVHTEYHSEALDGHFPRMRMHAANQNEGSMTTTELTGDAVFTRAFDEHQRVIEELKAQQPVLENIAQKMTEAIFAGRKVLWCGNGGSAADAQHLAAEFVGRFRRERKPLASIALTTDTSILTSIGNDYGYDQIFSRQVLALCEEGDIVVGISTSGNSPNVVEALEAAKECGAFTVAMTGQGGGRMAGIANASICVPTRDTARVQEGHILCGHTLCDWIELAWCQQSSKDPVEQKG